MRTTNSNPSPRRQLASRVNGRKSRGPRTAAGKAVVSRNAVSCGFYSSEIVLKPFDPAGTADEFTTLRQAIFDDLAPEGHVECVLVERIAAILWHQRRAYRLENQAILTPEHTLNPIGDAIRAAITRANNVPPTIFPSSEEFDKVIRYESLIDRQLNRALQQLARLRSGAFDRINDSTQVSDSDHSDPNAQEDPDPSHPSHSSHSSHPTCPGPAP